MQKIIFTIIFLLLFSSFGYGQDNRSLSDNVRYKFSRHGNVYSFVGEFPVKNNMNCLLDVMYNIDHLKRFNRSVDDIKLLRRDDLSYEAHYSYHKLFLKAKTAFRRTQDKNKRIVKSVMIEHEQNNNVFPKPLASHGHYRIKEDKSGRWFEYFRECEIESKTLDRLYFYLAEKEAIKHLYDMKDYIEKTCP